MHSVSFDNVIPRASKQFEGCTISKRDWEALLRGRELEKEKSNRNLYLGIAVSCGFGTLSTVASHFELLFSAGLPLLESIFFTLMLSATLAASALTAFFHRRVSETEPEGTLRLIDETIHDRLHNPEDPNDPRQWP